VKRSDFKIGQEFWCGGKRWGCTDIGTRVIVAICLEPHEVVTLESGKRPEDASTTTRHVTDDPSWHVGPPYGVEECVFDEYDMAGCSLQADEGHLDKVDG
jgi:hypothetical protein